MGKLTCLRSMDKQYVLKKYDKNNKRETIKVKYLFYLFCLAVIICSLSSKIKLLPCCIENTSNICQCKCRLNN